MNSKDLQNLAHYFKSHPNSKECFVTTDGTIFHTVGNATDHARTLKNKDVAPYTREAVAELVAAATPAAEATQTPTAEAKGADAGKGEGNKEETTAKRTTKK